MTLRIVVGTEEHEIPVSVEAGGPDAIHQYLDEHHPGATNWLAEQAEKSKQIAAAAVAKAETDQAKADREAKTARDATDGDAREQARAVERQRRQEVERLGESLTTQQAEARRPS